MMDSQIALPLAHRVKRLSHLDMPGGGQVIVQGDYAYIGHLRPPRGTTILDVSDPRKPRVVSQIDVVDPYMHSHKVRVVGDVMITNYERYNYLFMRKAERLRSIRREWNKKGGNLPTVAELAKELFVEEADIPKLEEMAGRDFEPGGFKIWDISVKDKPRLLADQRTWGLGVHRFDMDRHYAYISTEMEGFHGNILVIYDIREPRRPTEVSRWWMPGQNVAAGELPTWRGFDNRLHHTLRYGDHLYASCWHAGIRVINVADITQPKTVGEYNYHPPFPEPTHTFMRVPFKIFDRDVAVVVDEEHQHVDMRNGERQAGQPHAALWVFDISDFKNMKPLSSFQLEELDSPWSRSRGGRFGAHQFQEHMEGTLLYCTWFTGGLRIIDIVDPFRPKEVGYFIPQPVSGQVCPMTNDIDTDSRGLIYLLDRFAGFDILELERG
ncbi:MAG: RNA polymerase subunit sigma-70 [Burkholderiales bacterium]|nr:RNA polymerase subunit sigma-70 [Burkholderiales bacterium]